MLISTVKRSNGKAKSNAVTVDVQRRLVKQLYRWCDWTTFADMHSLVANNGVVSWEYGKLS